MDYPQQTFLAFSVEETAIINFGVNPKNNFPLYCGIVLCVFILKTRHPHSTDEIVSSEVTKLFIGRCNQQYFDVATPPHDPVLVLVTQFCLTLVTPWTVAHQAPLSMGFSRQAYWSWLPFPSPGDLSDPAIKPRSLALQADSLPSEPLGDT